MTDAWSAGTVLTMGGMALPLAMIGDTVARHSAARAKSGPVLPWSIPGLPTLGSTLLCLFVPLSAAMTYSGTMLIASCLLGWTLVLLSMVDRASYRLPDMLTLPLIAGGLIYAWLAAPSRFADHLSGAVLGFGLFFLVMAGYRTFRGRDGLGFGDVKLVAAAGAWIGWQALPVMILVASLSALAYVAASRWKPSEPLPFGPFLALGCWAAWLARL